jgi:hypothetical protein
MARRGGGGIGSGMSRGHGPANVDGGGGDRRGGKPEMSVTSWRQLSNKERQDFFGGTRPGSVKKKTQTAKQKRDAMRGDY